MIFSPLELLHSLFAVISTHTPTSTHFALRLRHTTSLTFPQLRCILLFSLLCAPTGGNLVSFTVLQITQKYTPERHCSNHSSTSRTHTHPQQSTLFKLSLAKYRFYHQLILLAYFFGLCSSPPSQRLSLPPSLSEKCMPELVNACRSSTSSAVYTFWCSGFAVVFEAHKLKNIVVPAEQ